MMETPFQKMHDGSMKFIEKEFVCEPVTIKISAVEKWSLKELRYACKNNRVKGYTKMDREQLVQHVKEIIKNMKPIKEGEWI